MTALSHGDYTVGWICALPLEMAAAKLMLDTLHPTLQSPSIDQNTYILGSIGAHNIVITCLPSGAYGTISATTVAMQLLSTFSSIRFGLMVGIGGGVPGKTDIRLGDIVVSQPGETSGGVIQYDLGKALHGSRFQRTGMLNRPPKVLLTALAALQAHHLTEDSQVIDFLSDIPNKTTQRRAANFARPTEEDCLYQADYDHPTEAPTCVDCDRSRLIIRPTREYEEPVIHYGLIASGNQVVKDGRLRDQVAQDLGVCCVEMEAAGLMNDFPCIVIRGICDYSDSHKNKAWQGYAAAAAAAYAKELLLVVPVNQVDNTPTVQNTLESSDSVDRFKVPLDLAAVPVIENFVGRQTELDSLWCYFDPKNSQIQSRKVAIVHGLGGMGKTQLAVRFVREHKHDFTAILWLNGKDRSTLLQSLGSALPRLPGHTQTNEALSSDDKDPEQRAGQVLRWLSEEGNSRWLIVLDNIDQYSEIDSDAGGAYDVGKFFPVADHGCILVTSRLPGLTELGESFPINKLDLTEATQLLLKNSGFSGNDTEKLEDDPDVLALTKRLDGLPLAIVIAAAFMRQTGTSVTQYMRYYQESWSELQSQSTAGRQYFQGNMLQTWMISYREIQNRDPNAANLLLLLARFNNRDIWFELVQHASCSSDVPAWLEGYLSSELAFKAGVKSLIQFSLLEMKQQGGSYAMHPVVQDWCIHVASQDISLSKKLLSLAFICVGHSVPTQVDRNSADLDQRLISHANSIYAEKISTDDSAVWGAFDGLGELFTDYGRLKDAEEMYRQALTGKENAFGPDHISTLGVIHRLGTLYRKQGKLKEAEEMYQRAFQGTEKTRGPGHVSSLGIIHSLAALYQRQGKVKEAEETFQQALTGREKAFGPNDPSTLDVVNDLGILYQDQGKLKDAEANFQRVLAGREKAFGRNHPYTLDMVNNLGVLYRRQGKSKEAAEHFEEALTGKQKVLGPNHPSTLDIVHNIGGLYQVRGRFKEAEENFRRVLAGREKSLGPSHPDVLKIVTDLGNLHQDQGRFEEAEENYQKALTVYEKVLGPDHTHTLKAVHNIGLLYMDQGRLQEAEENFQRALTGREKALGRNHISTLETLGDLGILYRKQKRLEEAEELYQETLTGRETALGPNHTSTLDIVNNLGLVYYDRGMLDDAEEMYQRALAGYKEALGPDYETHPSTLNTLNNLGTLYFKQGRLEDATEMYQQALEGREKVFGSDHYSVLDTLDRLDRLKLMEADDWDIVEGVD